jgi:hypothetical protein
MPIPKPVMTFVVGVTGHRSARLSAEHLPRIEQQLAAVFRCIEAECLAVLENHEYFDDTAAPQFRLITSLADGTDALAVGVRPKGWISVGVLPAPEEIYEETLKTTTPRTNVERALAQHEAVRETAREHMVILPGAQVKDNIGLVRAGNLMLHQIDMLIAVWDREMVDNAGGTSDLVATALRDGIPVIWIAADRDQQPWVLSQIEDVNRNAPLADATSGPIAETIQREFSLRERHPVHPEFWQMEVSGATAETRLKDFMAETVPHGTWVCYDNFKVGLFRPWKWRLSHPCPSVEEVRRQWAEEYLATAPEGGGFRERLDQILLPRFAAADALATYYGARYRGVYIMGYLLSAFAVLLALADLTVPDIDRAFGMRFDETVLVPVQRSLALLELAVVAAIILMVRWGYLGRWHQRWLDYRALAEMLRHLRFLGLLGQFEKRSYAEAAARPGAGWVLWYLRATMRELGLPTGELGPDYQRKALMAVLDSELDPQIRYHADNMEALGHLHHRLHRNGNLCFVTALIVLLAFLILSALEGTRFETVGQFAFIVPLLTAFLPALGAAFAGIRFTGDFEGDARRSAESGGKLDSLKEAYELVMDRLEFDTTTEFIVAMARVMAVDIRGWATLYSRKNLTLPG